MEKIFYAKFKLMPVELQHLIVQLLAVQILQLLGSKMGNPYRKMLDTST